MAVDREVRRDVNLPAFSIGIAELELIWTKLQSMFSSEEEPRASVSIQLPTEKLTFRTIDDLRVHPFRHARAKSFDLYIRAGDRSVMILSSGIFGTPARALISADSEIWCAGAQEAVTSVISQHKAWHHWLRPGALFALFFLFTIAGGAGLSYMKSIRPELDRALSYGFLGTMITLFALVFGREKLLPLATLRLTENESFLRRHMAELTLLVGAASAILTAIGLFRSGA